MRKGFTLLELLVTISIIGLLLGIGAVSFSTAQKRGRDSRRQGDMKAIQKSLEQCYSLDTAYPQAGSVESGDPLTCVGSTVTMNQVPSDPQPAGSYTYTVDTDPGATVYCLCAELENLGKGNADTEGTNGVCSWETTTDNNYFCVSNQQ